MASINAKVTWIKYYDETSMFAILSCSDDKENFSVKGTVPNPIRGQSYDFNGEWSIHPKYGRQFKVETCELAIPTSRKEIERLLSSGIVKGIGKTTAQRIVQEFGENSLKVIEESPEELLSVRGIGKKNLATITEGWRNSQELVRLQNFLQGCGVSANLTAKIYKRYGADSIETIKENPYTLTDLWGVNFKVADLIAKECDFNPRNPKRIRAGVKYLLLKNSSGGHCYERGSVLMARCGEFLKIDKRAVAEEVRKMLDEKDGIKEDDGAVYLSHYYYAEYGIAKKLYEINQFQGTSVAVDPVTLGETFGIEYDEFQINAIKRAVNSKVSIITGGPGTGKTTIIKAIVKAFSDQGYKVLLASPTGRAAKRMTEVVGMESKTIHRLLEYNPQEEFVRDESNPLEGDVLILDECSMIDILLMNHLLKAVPPHMNLVMVGDIDQLPSVGPGNVLADIINSECFYVARLETVFRQAEESDIVSNAHRINRGEKPIFRNRDIVYIQTSDIKGEIVKIAQKEDVQVLTPMKKTSVGTMELNNAIQEAVNPGETLVEKRFTKYKKGDRVMQIRNNYEKEIFNGSLGVVRSYDKEEGILYVDYDGVDVEYDQSDIDEIMLAYAITIHKSQGSEFPVVAIPLTMEHQTMLQRNLLYTAFTRPVEKLYLVGDIKAAEYAIGNIDARKRNTKLIERLKGWCREEEKDLSSIDRYGD